MNFVVVSIRDVKTGFMTPQFEINEQSAIRNFCHAVVNSDSVLASYCKDFALYRLGYFDSDSGKFVPEDLPVLLYEATDALRNFGGD